jgi:sulfoxide reductase heme-binding subunit YedZ
VTSSHVLWWLVSRAAGVVAMVLVSATVLLGLAMSSKVLRRPGVGRLLMGLHEHLALIAFAALGVHGLALLGDPWLHPGARGLLVPFALGYRPVFTGMGVLAGYLAAALGLSFYARRRIGAKRWRSLHRATLLVWGLALAHTLGAGSDGGTLWLRAVVLAPAVPIAYLTVLRVLGGRRAKAAGAAAPSRPPLRARLAEDRA